MTAKVLPGGEIIVPEFAEVARRLHSSATTGSEDMAMIESFIDFYMRANGGAVPQGSENEEIVAVLRGQNAHRLAVIPPDVRGIDDRGRLLDRWGTAYFFHPVSRTVLDVRSAGPDRRWWTDDDLIGRRAAAEATAGL